MPREVHVSWLRAMLYVAAAGLFATLLFYPPAGVVDPIFDPFDHRSLRRLMWFGDPPTRSEKVGWLNYLSAFAYLGAGATGLRGRAQLRRLAITLGVTAVFGFIGLAAILYLGAVDPARFSLSSSGMRLIELFHALGLGGLALAWWWLRRAALADPVDAVR